MKKTIKLKSIEPGTKRLALEKQSIRPLDDNETAAVVGGLWTNSWCRTCSCGGC